MPRTKREQVARKPARSLTRAQFVDKELAVAEERGYSTQYIAALKRIKEREKR